MFGEIFVIFVLLLLNAFFALSEMAIVSASKPLLRQYAKQGKKSASLALDLSENSARFLSTVQIGITLVGTLAGAYGGATIAEKLIEPLNQFAIISPHGEIVGVFIVVACITYFSVVIGELVPKQVALNNSETLAMFVAPPMTLLSKVFSPIVILLGSSAKFLLFLLRVKPKQDGVTETEIRAVIADGVESGAIEDDEHDVIRRVIRLGDRDVKSIMTHRTDVKFIDINDTMQDVRLKISEAGHSRYPVIDKDPTKILGYVKTKVMMVGIDSQADFKVQNYMTELTSLNENTSCLDALNIFRKKTIHMAAVIDEYGSFEGLFTTSDLLEAIVGTLPSNYDAGEEPLIYRRDDGSWLVDGLTPIEEIHIGIGLEEIESDADYQTIGGFVLTHLKTSPRVGDSFTLHGHVFEIVDMDKFRVDKILIKKL